MTSRLSVSFKDKIFISLPFLSCFLRWTRKCRMGISQMTQKTMQNLSRSRQIIVFAVSCCNASKDANWHEHGKYLKASTLPWWKKQFYTVDGYLQLSCTFSWGWAKGSSADYLRSSCSSDIKSSPLTCVLRATCKPSMKEQINLGWILSG